MIISGCAGSFVAPGSLGSECAESPEPEVVVHFGSGGNSSAVYLVFECFWYFAGAVFGTHHPNPLLHSCKWDSLVPICIVLLLGVLSHSGLAVLVLGAQFLWAV